MARPPFISLDGLDGVGKSTQTRLLAQWLRTQGLAVAECTDPGGTALGTQLRTILLSFGGSMGLPCEALLFMASRAQLVAEVIRPALEAGQAVLSDRFLLANVVYQGHGGGLDPQKIWEVGLFSTGGLEPDLTLVLDLPLADALTRRKPNPDRLERRGLDFHARVRDGFLAEAKQRPDCIRVVDAGGATDEVQVRLRREVQRHFPMMRAGM
jgi:dTMP kinase